MFEWIKRSIERYINVANATEEYGKNIVNYVLDINPDAIGDAERLRDICGSLQSNLRIAEDYAKQGKSIRPTLTHYIECNKGLRYELKLALNELKLALNELNSARKDLEDYRTLHDSAYVKLESECEEAQRELEILKDKHRKERRDMVSMTFAKIDDYKRVCDDKLEEEKNKLLVSEEEVKRLKVEFEEALDDLKNDRALLRVANEALTRKLEEANKALEQLMKIKNNGAS